MGALIVWRHFASDQVAGTTIVTCHHDHDYDDGNDYGEDGTTIIIMIMIIKLKGGTKPKILKQINHSSVK